MQTQRTAQRVIVLVALDHDRTHPEPERIAGDGVTDALKVLVANGVVVRRGERVWASPATHRSDELGLIAIRAPIRALGITGGELETRTRRRSSAPGQRD